MTSVLILLTIFSLALCQQEFTASYSLGNPSLSGLEKGNVSYSWGRGKILYRTPSVDDLWTYKPPATGVTQVTCDSAGDGVSGCLIGATVTTDATDGSSTITFSFGGSKCQLSHWVLPIPDCVDANAIVVTGSREVSNIGDTDICTAYPGIATNRQLKIDGSGPFSVTMPGGIPGQSYLGIKGGTDCGSCLTVGFTCEPPHVGEKRFQSCGTTCQSSTVEETQPKFFLDTTEYGPSTGTKNVGGRVCNIHPRKTSATGPVQTLYHDGTTVCGADFSDNRQYVFTGVVTGRPSLPANPTCGCSAPLDIAVIYDVGKDVAQTKLAKQIDAVVKFAESFTYGTKGAQFAIFEQKSDGTVRTVLSIEKGNTLVNVQAAARSFSCTSASGACVSGTSDGNAALAITTAATNLAQFGRSFAPKAIITISNGYSNTAGQVDSAVNTADATLSAFDVTFIGIGIERTATLGLTTAELSALADGKAANIYEWQDFTTFAYDPSILVGATCAANSHPCGASCCGLCACGVCQPVHACPPPALDSCSTLTLGEFCCQETTKPCVPENPCAVSTCVDGVCQESGGCPPSNGCFDFACVSGKCTSVAKAHPADTPCTTYACIGNAWVAKEKECTGNDPTNCTLYGCNIQDGTCTETTKPACVVSTCPTTPCEQKDCFTSVCNADGSCTWNAMNCNDDILCTVDSCLNNECVHTTKTCSGSDPCFSYACNNSTGACAVTKADPLPAGCSPSAPVTTPTPTPSPTPVAGEPVPTPTPTPSPPSCTIDSCSITDPCYSAVCVKDKCVISLLAVCQPTPTCFCDDNNTCTLDSCDLVTGQCVFETIECNSLNKCGVASCDTASGCIFTPFTADHCDDDDLCTDDTCDSSVGCVNTPVVCQDQDNCTVDQCDPFIGCLNAPVACNRPANAPNCSISFCDNSTTTCSTEEQDCFIAVAALIGGITGGVIAAIVIAGIVGFAVVGGGTAAAATQTVFVNEEGVFNNPLFQGGGNAADNPVFSGA